MIANITTLSDFTGTATIAGIARGPVNNSVPTVVDEPIPGFIRQIKLSPEGVTIVHAGRAVRIPLPLLIAIAARVDPTISPACSSVNSVTPVNPVSPSPDLLSLDQSIIPASGDGTVIATISPNSPVRSST